MLKLGASLACLALSLAVAHPARGDAACLLSISRGIGWSEATGQHTLSFELRNRGATSCGLNGYPRVVFEDARGPVPLAIHHGGDQMLTTRRPRLVRIAPGARAYVAVNEA